MTAAKAATANKRPAKKAPAKAAAKPAAADPEPTTPDPEAHLTEGDKAWVDRHTALASGDEESPMAAEVAVEDIPDGHVAVPLGPHGDIVHIKPRTQWRSSHLAALHSGNLEEWAAGVLFRPDYDRIWVGLDPTVDEVQAMLRTWSQLTGQPDPGKSPVTRGSLRNGRRS